MSYLSSKHNDIKISCIHSDEKLGTYWAVGTDKQWLEFRTTKAGKIKIIRQEKGNHPYFTINSKEASTKGGETGEH